MTAYDLSENEEYVDIKGKDGVVRKYVITEPSEEASRLVNNALVDGIEGFEMRDGKSRMIKKAKDIADADSRMLSMCLFLLCDENGEPVSTGEDPAVRKAVPIGEIRGWPRRVVKDMAAKARKLGGEEEEEDDEDLGKNLPVSTTTGSE